MKLFECGPSGNTSHPLHDHFPDNKYFFECHGDVELQQVQALAESICTASGSSSGVEKYKEECLYKFLFNSSSEKLQKNVFQPVKTYERCGKFTFKTSVTKVAQDDAEAARLATNDL